MTEILAGPVTLTAEWSHAHLARAVPGSYFDDDQKAWLLPDPTPRAAMVALRLFPELEARYPELVEQRALLAFDARPFDNATPFNQPIKAALVREALAQEGKDLYNFQAIDAGYLKAVLEEHGAAYCGHERGLGKTLTSCALIDDLGCAQTLIIAPNTAKESVWGAELRRWCPWLDVVVLPNQKDKRDRTMAAIKQKRADGEPFALIVHYEAVPIIAGKKFKSTSGKSRTEIGHGWDKYGNWDLVICDEVHRIKEPKTQIARAVKRIPTAYKLALSGSIIQNHAEELFSVLQWLFPDNYRSKWRDWNDRFLDYVDSSYGKMCLGIKLDRVEEMRNELGVFMTYRRKEDELDLPEKTEQTLLVDLSPGQRRVYDELRASCLAELPDGTRVKAADGLVMLTKLRQVASGLDLLGNVEDSSKIDAAMELIADNEDEAFVVFNWYRASGYSLQERLTNRGIESFLVDGSVSQETRAEYIERFQAGERRVFLGTIATLGESVTLHRASNAVFIDRSWNPGANLQAADRVYRIGQSKPVTITQLVARDTVDELRVMPVLSNKEALRSLLLGGS